MRRCSPRSPRVLTALIASVFAVPVTIIVGWDPVNDVKPVTTLARSVPSPAAQAEAGRADPEPGVLTHALAASGFAVRKARPIRHAPQPLLIEPNPVYGYVRTKLNLPDYPVKTADPMLVEGPAQDWVRVTGASVNLRTGPGVSSLRLDSFVRGTRLRMLAQKRSWTKVANPVTDQVGWMSGNYLTRETAPDLVVKTPTTPEPTPAGT